MFARHPEWDAVTGHARFTTGPRPLRSLLARAYLGAYRAVLAPTLGHAPLFGSNMAMRRRAWLAVSAHVHRDDPHVHDDLDLAFHLGRDHRVVWSGGLDMGMSMRALADPGSFGARVRRGFHTVVRHWPGDFPPRRWARRRRGAHRRRRSERVGR
jgi:hypothetical protein